MYHPTIKPREAVNSVELQGGKQCYLIVGFIFPLFPSQNANLIMHQLEELGELEPAILENQAKLNACDVICYTYDSSDPNSFSHIVELRVQTHLSYAITLTGRPTNGSLQKKYPHLDEVPAIYAALKADQDKTTQRCDLQPDDYTRSLHMSAPLHVSVTWTSITELFVHVRLSIPPFLSSSSSCITLPKIREFHYRSQKQPSTHQPPIPNSTTTNHRSIERTCISLSALPSVPLLPLSSSGNGPRLWLVRRCRSSIMTCYRS